MSDEASMTAEKMGDRIIEVMDKGFDNFTPRSEFDIIKVENYVKPKVTHNLLDY